MCPKSSHYLRACEVILLFSPFLDFLYAYDDLCRHSWVYRYAWVCVQVCVCACDACARGQSALVMKLRPLKKSERAHNDIIFFWLKVSLIFVLLNTHSTSAQHPSPLDSKFILSNLIVCVVAAREASIFDWPVCQPMLTGGHRTGCF